MHTFHPSRHSIELAAQILDGSFAAAVVPASVVATGTLVVAWLFS